MRSLFVASILAFLGCSNRSSGLLDPPNISGQIKNWTYGAGFTIQATMGRDDQTIATTPIDESGNFLITLPPLDTVRGLLTSMGGGISAEPGCTDNVYIYPNEDYLAGNVAFQAVSGRQKIPISYGMPEIVATSSSAIGSFIYVDSNHIYEGNSTCTINSFKDSKTFDIYYQTGLNRSFWTIVYTDRSIESNYSTGEVPVGVVWFQFDGPAPRSEK